MDAYRKSDFSFYCCMTICHNPDNCFKIIPFYPVTASGAPLCVGCVWLCFQNVSMGITSCEYSSLFSRRELLVSYDLHFKQIFLSESHIRRVFYTTFKSLFRAYVIFLHAFLCSLLITALICFFFFGFSFFNP